MRRLQSRHAKNSKEPIRCLSQAAIASRSVLSPWDLPRAETAQCAPTMEVPAARSRQCASRKKQLCRCHAVRPRQRCRPRGARVVSRVQSADSGRDPIHPTDFGPTANIDPEGSPRVAAPLVRCRDRDTLETNLGKNSGVPPGLGLLPNERGQDRGPDRTHPSRPLHKTLHNHGNADPTAA